METSHKNIDAILCEAVEIESATEREAFLDEKCGDDAELRQRLDKLITDHFRAGSFLEHPMVGERPTEVLNALTDREGVPAPTPSEISLDFLKPCDDPDRLGMIGPYEVIEVIGRGGMGVVLRAHDPKLNRVVAIKVLAPEFAANPTARKRFVREAQAAAGISHPHVVGIHAVDDEENTPYLVMECVDGQSLQEKIERVGHMRLREILRIGSQTAEGLAAAHSQGLIHRDVKPGNILLENGVERVKITDFGLARAVDDVGMTRTGDVAGTPLFMSPEQAQGQTLDQRSDLFSLGSVLYAMCTGRAPFRAETTVATMRRVCDDAPRAIREVNPEIPDFLVEIIDRLLAKNREARFQTAAEVSNLLGRHLAHVQDPGSSPFPGSIAAVPGRNGRPRHRRWLLAIVLLLAVIGAVGLTEATGVTKFAATVIRIATGEGTLVIDVDDPTVKVSIDGTNGNEVTITGAGVEEVRLRPGEYRFKATKDGKPVKEELVTITRGGREVVSVTLEPGSSTGSGGATSEDYESIPEGAITEVRRFESHSSRSRKNSLAFTPDGRLLISAQWDAPAVLLWDVLTGKRLRVIDPSGGAFCAAVSPDGRRVAVGYGDRGGCAIRIWKTEDWAPEIEWTGSTRDVLAIRFSPKGDRLVSAGRDGIVRLWDVETGEALHDWKGVGQSVWDVSYSPDGRYLLAMAYDGVALLDAETCGEIRRIKTGETTHDVAFSPDGRLVAAGDVSQSVYVWETETGKQVVWLSHQAGRGRVTVVDFCDSDHVVSASTDGTIRVWDIRSGRVVGLLRSYESLDEQAWPVFVVSPDGKHLLSSVDGEVVSADERAFRLWRLPEVWPKGSVDVPGIGGQRPLAEPVPSPSMHMVPGQPLSPMALVREPAPIDGALSWTLETRGHRGDIRALRFSEDGKLLATAGEDGTIRLWNSATGRLVRRLLRMNPGLMNRHSPSRLTERNLLRALYVTCKFGMSTLASCCGRVAVPARFSRWIGHSMESYWPQGMQVLLRRSALLTPHQARSYIAWQRMKSRKLGLSPFLRTAGCWPPPVPKDRCGFGTQRPGNLSVPLRGTPAAQTPSPGHRTAGGCPREARDKTVRIWDAGSGMQLHKLEQSWRVHAVAWSPDGSMLASGCETLTLWDVDTGMLLKTADGPGSCVYALDWSPDPEVLAAADLDGCVRFWDDELRGPLQEIHGSNQLPAFSLSPDGHYRGPSELSEHFVYVVQTEKGRETLTAEQFAAEYKWINDPERARPVND